MKKILLSLLLATSLFITSCAPIAAASEEDEFYFIKREEITFTTTISTVLDRVTGVEYIVCKTNRGISICPRYNADGTLFTANQEE